MKPVYHSYFGLTEAPFNITPDPAFLFMSASHREALAQLSYGISSRRGFVVLTGEVGTGKTTLVQALLGQLGTSTQTALIFSAIPGPVDLLRYVCEEFKLVEPRHPRSEVHDYMSLLNQFLLEQYRQGENSALIIDEAQNLTPEVLESIRLLSNFETPKDKLLQILLVGQPELAVRLNAPELRQLKQRVTLRHHLRPLSLNECQDYIANRLQLAGGEAKIFTSKAVETIYLYSGGIPRLVNVICDNAMLSVYALGKKEVEATVIREIAEDLSLTSSILPAPSAGMDVSKPNGVRTANGNANASESIQQKQPTRTVMAADDNHKTSSAQNGFVPVRIFDAIKAELIEAMGPMAEVVLAERVKLLGGGMDRFPRNKFWNLVETVSQEIFDKSMRDQFCRTMSEGVRMMPKS